ncbi:MAG: shikimate dehydrogenase [Actinobacteria bacterium]|nr:shikimate dehydrogenase [Actinomycetota bacterium]
MAGVVGDPVRHSLSPVIHNAAFSACGIDWVYVAFPVLNGGAPRAIEGARALGIAGLSVTMPHKSVAAEVVDRLTPLAARLGAVNTIVSKGAELVGYSTDGAGFIDSLKLEGDFEPAGRRCMVLGAGGAARAVILALAQSGVEEVLVVNRSNPNAAQAAVFAGERGRVASPEEARDVELVVNATPVGMQGSPAAGRCPLDPAFLGPGQLVVDLIYRPSSTALLEQAAKRGARVMGGLGMLVHQAARAFTLWTGLEAPVQVMMDAAREACQP